MKKSFIKVNDPSLGTVTIEQMVIGTIAIGEEHCMIVGNAGPTAESDFSVFCTNEQLRQICLEANRHPQGLGKVAEDARAGRCRTYDFDEPLFINNVHLHAVLWDPEKGKTPDYRLQSLTVTNSNDNDRIWAAYTAQICNEYLCTYSLASRRGRAEPISENLIQRIAYLELRRTFSAIASARH